MCGMNLIHTIHIASHKNLLQSGFYAEFVMATSVSFLSTDSAVDDSTAIADEDNGQSLDEKVHLWLNLIGLPVVMVMSAIGNTLSFMVMMHKTVRMNTTSW